MVIYVLDKNLAKQDRQLDLYSSLVWNPRYQEPGTFQLNCDPSYFDLLNKKDEDVFILNTDDLDHVGVVENIRTKKDESGIELVVKGRMAESILGRRVALGEYSFVDTNVVTIFTNVLTPNMIDSTDATRNIPIFEIGVSSGITDISTSEIQNENILTMVQRLCRINDLGFKVSYGESAGVPKLKLVVYKGEDRTQSQSGNNVAVISRGQDTSQGSEYLKDTSKITTYAHIKGEGDFTTSVSVGSPTGLIKREVFLDLSSLITRVVNNPDGGTTVLSDEDYIKALQSGGRDALAGVSESISNEFNPYGGLVYGVDFNMGDLVTCIEDVLGYSVDKTVYGVEVVYDKNGKTIALELGEYLTGNSAQLVSSGPQAVTLSGLSTSTNAAVVDTDSVTVAVGKLQAQVSSRVIQDRGTITQANLNTTIQSGNYNFIDSAGSFGTVGALWNLEVVSTDFETNDSITQRITQTYPAVSNEFTRTYYVATGWTAWRNAKTADFATNADTVDSKHAVDLMTTNQYSPTDLNAATASGAYRLNTGHTNMPAGADYSTLLVVHGRDDTIFQIIVGYSNAAMWVRAGNPPNVGGSGAYTTWRVVANGVPSAAIATPTADVASLKTAVDLIRTALTSKGITL